MVHRMVSLPSQDPPSGRDLRTPGAPLRCLGTDCQRKLGAAQRHAEDRAPWFEQATSAQTVEAHCVIADAFDECGHRAHRARIVASHSERAAVWRASWPAFLFELVVAKMVERLHDGCVHQPALNDLAATGTMILEQFHSSEIVQRRLVNDLAATGTMILEQFLNAI